MENAVGPDRLAPDTVAPNGTALHRTDPREAAVHRATVTLSLRGAGILIVSVLAFGLAYLLGWPELLILACFCGIPPLLALLFVARMRPRVRLSRFVSPTILTVGSTGATTLRLERSGGRGVDARWSDTLPWSPGRTPRMSVLRHGSGDRSASSSTVQYAFVPPRRGIADLGPLVIEVVDPFGLARCEFSVGERQRVIVAPETVPLDEGTLNIASDSGSARLFQHRALAGEHDIMTRDYRPGDAIRRVHWRASAHYGSLMVREDEKRSHAEATVLVDTRRASWQDVVRNPSPDVPESERFEWALTMVASLRDRLVRSGIHVRVVETAVAQLADADHGDSFVESLARLRLSYQDGPAIHLAQSREGSSGSVFAVVSDPDTETREALCAQRHGFDLAVAFILGSGREELATRMRQAGWTVQLVSAGESVAQAWLAVGTGNV